MSYQQPFNPQYQAPTGPSNRPSVWPSILFGWLGGIYSAIKAARRGYPIGRYFIAPGISTALVVVIAIAAGSGSGGYSGPALTPGSATAQQICDAAVGQGVQNTITGQDTHETVVSESDAAIISNPDASGNEIATCAFTLDTGAQVPVTVTLFANGSIGWHGGS